MHQVGDRCRVGRSVTGAHLERNGPGHTALAPAAAAASNGASSWAHIFEADAARASDRELFQVLGVGQYGNGMRQCDSSLRRNGLALL